MTVLLGIYHRLTAPIAHLDGLLPILARFVFAAVLLPYFWASAMTKLGDGVFGIFVPSAGAYAQIFPRAMEAAGFDTSQLSFLHTLVVLAGTWAEFILPLLLILGLLTRAAALGMIGFIVVQSLTDLYGHGGIDHAETLGAWFDRQPDSLILDQRALWMLVLLVPAIKGAGALSLDAVLFRNAPLAHPVSPRQGPESRQAGKSQAGTS
ncbi:DoxX family membrane protein [Lutimaribacter sp. EGI FJ00015]|uniref:DoxX family membrane protein n=1 Tax=Lutimaribacter degradans TaxID=2945989 RepID=A0ACC5ZQH6_9RHOB|nr:DoxX family membrane protein [Lutimaribacter sp. EGI FJ00013]MCM2560557.1 DoxX family membrane protein [Lutimaribacter sp. EGI FJ00013]MCO0612500.1 DoxX family membrane protein [Lutimaribacter sp. EGI FJ00015]MCO0634381.1 DoxX family membrane protein [Lutimaribacter sp. EGI FJ00014]